MKERSIGGCNFTCTKIRKRTTRSQDSAWSLTQKCTQHSLTLQEMQLGMLSRSLVIVSSAECSTPKMTLEKKKHTQELEATNQQLRGDIIDLIWESCEQDRQMATNDALIAILSSE